MSSSSDRRLVTFRGGFVADWSLVERLIEIEHKGGRFHLLDDGRFAVRPSSILTSTEADYLRAHRDEARQVLEYVERTCSEAPV